MAKDTIILCGIILQLPLVTESPLLLAIVQAQLTSGGSPVQTVALGGGAICTSCLHSLNKKHRHVRRCTQRPLAEHSSTLQTASTSPKHFYQLTT